MEEPKASSPQPQPSSGTPAMRLDKHADFTEALKRHPGIGSFVGREIRALHTLLGEDECLLDVISGMYANQTGLLLSTPRRLIFFAKGLVSTKVEEFPLSKVSSLQYETGMLLGSLTIFASGNKAEIQNTLKAHTRSFAEGVRARLQALEKPASAPVVAPPVSDVTAEIERLAALKERGLLDDAEFTAAKRKALGL